MKVLELNLPEPTVARLEEAAERLSVSPEDLGNDILDSERV